MNTHSKEADCRMEILSAFAIRAGVGADVVKEVLVCVNTEEAIRLLLPTGLVDRIMQMIVEKICFYMEKRSGQKLEIDCILFSNEMGELAKSKGVEKWFTLLEQEPER